MEVKEMPREEKPQRVAAGFKIIADNKNEDEDEEQDTIVENIIYEARASDTLGAKGEDTTGGTEGSYTTAGVSSAEEDEETQMEEKPERDREAGFKPANGHVEDDADEDEATGKKASGKPVIKEAKKRGRPSGSSGGNKVTKTTKTKRPSTGEKQKKAAFAVVEFLAAGSKRFKGGPLEKALLARWHGYPLVEDLTWEPERNMVEDAPELVEDFYKTWEVDERSD